MKKIIEFFKVVDLIRTGALALVAVFVSVLEVIFFPGTPVVLFICWCVVGLHLGLYIIISIVNWIVSWEIWNK